MNSKPLNWLSASKIKTIDLCSFIYYCNYLLKLPKSKNQGSQRGDITHDILEVLGNKKRFTFAENIRKSRIFPKSVIRWIEIRLKKESIFSEDNLDKIKNYILVALDNDFWMEGGELQKPETYFEIQGDFNVKGYIDRWAIYTDEAGDKYAKIIDFKTQKELFKQEELAFSLQAFIYLMAAKNICPGINLEKSVVKFIMLAYPETPVQEARISNSQNNGLSEYLKYLQGYIDKFTEKDKTSNLAADKGFPKYGEPFGGQAKCGRAKFPGDLKKDGVSKQYYCEYKFPFDYYVELDKNGIVVQSSSVNITPKNGNKVEKRKFEGCPKFKGNNKGGNEKDLFNLS